MGNDIKKEHPFPKTQPQLKINHQKFQHFTYHQQEDLIQIQIQAENERDIKRWWDHDLKMINSFQDKQAFLLPRKYQYHARGFCGTVGLVKIYYDNYPYVFEQQIDNRIDMGKHFTQEQLWYLLYSLVSSARDFNKINTKIGDVRPYNIFINEDGQIKIANLFSWPYQKTNFEKTAFEKQLTYLSPQELRLIGKGNHQNNTNKVLSESFSIGLTLLQSGLLFNVKELYSIEHFSFDLDKLNYKLNQWQRLQFIEEDNNYHTYSPLFKTIVALLCHPDDRERISSLAVEGLLRPYQNQILNLKEFDHRNIQLSANQPQQTIPQPIPQPIPPPTQTYTNFQKPIQTMPPQPSIITFPQQIIKVNNPLQPKYNSQHPFNTNNTQTSIRFTKGEPIYTNDNYQQEHFHKYPANPPVETQFRQPQILNSQNYEQQFYKYSSFNQITNLPPGVNIPPFPTNALNMQTGSSSQPTLNQMTLPPYNPTLYNPPSYNSYHPTTFTSSAFTSPAFTSTFSRPQTTTQVVTSIPQGEPSDFLRRIDQQLQTSRKQFPS